jgi:hypothetical protein
MDPKSNMLCVSPLLPTHILVFIVQYFSYHFFFSWILFIYVFYSYIKSVLHFIQNTGQNFYFVRFENTRWFKYDRDYLCVNKSQFVPVIFEPPCN